MKKLIYLIVLIVAFGLIVAGCIPVVPPTEQNEPGSLPNKSPGVVLNVTTSDTYGTIQAAIDAALPGETISVGDGIYPEAITIGVANLTLQSETNLGAIIRPTVDCSAVIFISADGVTVDGFEIDGTTVANNGILGWETSGLTIKNNKIHGAVNAWDGCGILLFSWGNGGTVYDNLIENNEVYDTGRMGIMVMDYGTTYSVTSGNTITGNTVYDVWKVTWGDHGGGIQINVGKDCAITNNEVYDVQSGQRGIYMFGSASGNTIIGNTLRDNEIGIQLWISGEGGTSIDWGGESPTSPEVHFNEIYGNSSYGAISTHMVMDAIHNWWGHASGPSGEYGRVNKQGKVIGKGDAVSNYVNWDPWLSQPTVPPTQILNKWDLKGSFISHYNNYIWGDLVGGDPWEYSIHIKETMNGDFSVGTIHFTSGDINVIGIVEQTKRGYNYAGWVNYNTLAVAGRTQYNNTFYNFLLLYCEEYIWLAISSTADLEPYWTDESVWDGGDRDYQLHTKIPSEETFDMDPKNIH